MSIKDTLQKAADAIGHAFNPESASTPIEDAEEIEKKRRAQQTSDSNSGGAQPYVDSYGVAGGDTTSPQSYVASQPTDSSFANSGTDSNAFSGATAGADATVGDGGNSSFDGASADAGGSFGDSGGGSDGVSGGGDGGG